MIRYPITTEELRAKIAEHAPRWLRKAAARTEIFARLGRYSEENNLTPFWSEVKQVFISLQHKKCIYCEKLIEGGPGGAVEWDLEHFRPKGGVRRWTVPPDADIPDCPLGTDFPEGYYLLAYHPANYAAACKTCNTAYKSNCFPVAGKRIGGKREPEEYRGERPYLVHPLDTGDDAPESLITFEGVTALPKPIRGPRRRRAQVMIAFFALNRYELRYQRSLCLLALNALLKLAQAGDVQAQKEVEWFLSEKAPFANCSRCFARLFTTNPDAVYRHVNNCRALVDIELVP